MAQNLYINKNAVNGYLNANADTISNMSATFKEQTSDWIDVQGESVVTIQCWNGKNLDSENQEWIAYAFYTEKDMSTPTRTRVAKYSDNGGTYLAYVAVAVPSDAKYLRVSYRRLPSGGACKVDFSATATPYELAPEDGKSFLDLSGLQHFWGQLRNFFAPKDRGVEYIRGTWTAASGTWTGVSKDDELYDGKQIILYMPFAGSGNATLNLTLADGTTTGAKNVYFENTTRFATQKTQNAQLHLIYHEAQTLSDGNTYEGWWYVANRDTNDHANTIGYSYSCYKTKTDLHRYQILFTIDETTLIPVNSVNSSTATTKTLTTESFNPFGQIYYYNSTTNISADSLIGNSNLRSQLVSDFRYSFNTGKTLVANKAVFLVCVPQSDGKVKLHSNPISQSLPNTDDGLIYIHLGQAYDTYRVYMHLEKPIYYFKNGVVRKYTNAYEPVGAIASCDLDTLTSTMVGQLITENTYTNAPATSGMLEVVASGSGQCVQRLYDGSSMYYRYRSGSGFGSWYQVTATIV